MRRRHPREGAADVVRRNARRLEARGSLAVLRRGLVRRPGPPLVGGSLSLRREWPLALPASLFAYISLSLSLSFLSLSLSLSACARGLGQMGRDLAG